MGESNTCYQWAVQIIITNISCNLTPSVNQLSYYKHRIITVLSIQISNNLNNGDNVYLVGKLGGNVTFGKLLATQKYEMTLCGLSAALTLKLKVLNFCKLT